MYGYYVYYSREKSISFFAIKGNISHHILHMIGNIALI